MSWLVKDQRLFAPCEYPTMCPRKEVAFIKKKVREISLVAQWLTPLFHCKGAQVQSMAGELRSHMPCSTPKEKRHQH